MTSWISPSRLMGAGILLGVVWWAGTDPFVAGVRSLDGPTVFLGLALGVLTTVAAAWRWRLVARGLHLDLPLGRATAAYYRSQLLNSTLPGGVVGDVLRGVDHGRAVADPARALRSVAWERTVGQVVQSVLAVVVLVSLPSPVSSALPVMAALLVVGGLVLVTLGRAWAAVRVDAAGLLEHRVWPGVVALSVVVVAGHAATFVVAARAAGVGARPETLLPLALLVLVAAAVPANIAGWGPREGMAAWAFGAAGLGAQQGVATSVVFGVMVMVAALPGVVTVLVEPRLHRAARTGRTSIGGRQARA